VTVYNKADKLNGTDLTKLHQRRRHLLVSALNPDTTRPLLEEVEQHVL
jgi:50S ribosomal subunit-associated GTPase HflX